MLSLDSNSNLILDAEDIAIPEIKKLWDRDKTKDKSEFMKEGKYIDLFCRTTSPYINLSEDQRKIILGKDLFNNADFKPDKILQEAIDKYNFLKKRPEEYLLEGAKEAMYKIAAYLKITSIDNRSLMSINKAIDNIGKLLQSYGQLKDAVDKETTKAGLSKGAAKRGNRETPKSNGQGNFN